MLEATTRTIPAPTARAPLLVFLWAAVGVAISVAGIVPRLPALAPAFVATSVIGGVLAYRRGGALRAWADALPLRALIALHIVRLPIGLAFLWELSRGALPALFATRAGYGDIGVGVLALGAVTLAAARTPAQRGGLALFSLVGLADILVALGTATYLLLIVHDPLMLAAIARLPYPLLPFFLVPVVILSHLLALARLRR